MKSLHELKSTLNESATPERQRFDALVRAGLMDKSQLPKLHRVMDKISQEQPLSTSERQVVVDLVNELTHLATSNLAIFQKMRQAVKEEHINEIADTTMQSLYHKEPPPLIVMRRKAIRMYPHDTKVALYYSDKLDRYLSVPYSDTTDET